MDFIQDFSDFLQQYCGHIDISNTAEEVPEARTYRCFSMKDGIVMNFIAVPRPYDETAVEAFAAQIRADAVASATAMRRLGENAAVVHEDRWLSDTDMMKARIAAHLGFFCGIMGRNCEVRRIDAHAADDFLERYHSYGRSQCKYRYGLFVKRVSHKESAAGLNEGNLVAVSTFSGARTWNKPEGTIKSYEWIRYACLPGIRINGGMGKMLNAFIDEARPDDIMSYADLEWSDGNAYRELGFKAESDVPPNCYIVSGQKREPLKRLSPEEIDNRLKNDGTSYLIYNLGSRKYRLRIFSAEQSCQLADPQND